jgi:hypothetical protein
VNPRRALSVLLVLAVTGPAVPAGAAGAGSPPAPVGTGPVGTSSVGTVGAAMVGDLVAASGPNARADDSTATGCQGGAAAEPVGYRTDRIAVRGNLPAAVVAARVQSALAGLAPPLAVPVGAVERVEFPAAPGHEPVAPVTYVSFAAEGPPVPVVALARRLRTHPTEPTAASPVYLMGPSDGPLEMWPEDAPDATTEVPPVRDPSIGAGVTVAVYDTGEPDPADGDSPPNLSRLTADDREPIDVAKPFGVADHGWDGHTLAIADVIATVAPGALVKAVKITQDSGVATEESATRRMATTLRAAHALHAWPSVVEISSGTAVCDVDPARPWIGDMPPLGLQMVSEAIAQHDRALFIASAGNRSTSRRYYPAAFDHDTVVAVGALDVGSLPGATPWTSPSRSGKRAWFSNHGHWVDAYAGGVRLATRHLRGVRFFPNGPELKGRALNSGTSFTAPYVAALVAERMAATGQRAEDAWADIAASGNPCVGLGGGVAVTLTGLTAGATAPAAPDVKSEC